MIPVLGIGVAIAAWKVVEVAAAVTAVAGSVTAVATAARSYYDYKKTLEDDDQ